MKPMRHYVVSVYGPPPDGTADWFERLRVKEGAPEGTYGYASSKQDLGWMVVSVAESFTGPHVLGQSWVYATLEAAEKEARSRRRRSLRLAQKRATRRRPVQPKRKVKNS